MLIREEQLKALYRATILSLGGTVHEARTFADLLVVADLRGMDWQGLRMLDRHYVFDIQQGNIRLGQPLETVTEGPSSVVYEAENGLGQVACSRAMRTALDKAAETGAAVAVVRHCGDTGLLAAYTMMALERDGIGIMFNNTNPYVAPWGGREATHGIDPLSVAIPADETYPIVLDMSITEAQPYFDVLERRSPPFGQPPTMHFKTVREYALSVVVEAICGALATMPIGRERVLRGESAVVAMAIHVPHFVAAAEFRRRVDEYVRGVKSTPAGEGEEVLLPGERGFREHARRAAHGIPVPDDIWSAALGLFEDLGVEWRLALEAPERI